MNYYILCPTFRHAVVAATAFAKHYSQNGVDVVKRQTEVKVGDHRFIFINANDPRSVKGVHKGLIPLKEFTEKYFTPKKQTL